MSKKIKIKRLPKFRGGGLFGSQIPSTDNQQALTHYGNDPEIKIRRTLQPTSRDKATLEAEKGETAITNLQHEGIPEFYNIGGKPHSKGGTPLNLPPNSFIFSKDKTLAIKDPETLEMFGKNKTKPKGFTPAELSLQYNLNKYREILANPFSDKLQKETAELMIKNYNLKLGALALAQESKKGFDKGIPAIALPYMEHVGIQPEELLISKGPTENQLQHFKKGGPYSGKRKIKITRLPKYKKAGTVGIPKDARKWDADAEGYDPSKIVKGDYVLKDGVWHEVTGHSLQKFKGPLINDPRLGDKQQAYSMLVDKFNDPELRKAFVEQYKNELKKTKPSAHLTQTDIDNALAMSSDDIIRTFLYKQKVNLAINRKLGSLNEYDKKNLWDHNPNLANQTAVELGYKPFNTTQNAAFQAGYAGLYNLKKDPKYSEDLKNYGMFQMGTPNESGKGTGNSAISEIDGWDGNTTSGQIVLPKDTELTMKTVKEKDKEDKKSDVKHMPEYRQEDPAKFWLQDQVNTLGATGDYLKAKKYEPWQAVPEYNEYNPQFTDFRGAAARAAAYAKGLNQATGMFSGPQGQGAFQANLMRHMVNPILQLQEQENRTNINAADQAGMRNAQARNQFNAMKAGLDTNLYDKSVRTNQAFDNTKKALAWNMRKQFNNAWTNRGKTQVLNSLRDNFKVDPRTGMLHFTDKGRLIEPENNNTQSIEKQIADILKRNPEWDTKDAIRALELQNKITSPHRDSVGVNDAAYNLPI